MRRTSLPAPDGVLRRLAGLLLQTLLCSGWPLGGYFNRVSKLGWRAPCWAAAG